MQQQRVERAGSAGRVDVLRGGTAAAVVWPEQRISPLGAAAAGLLGAGWMAAWWMLVHPAVAAVYIGFAVFCKMVDERACWARPGWWVYDLLNGRGAVRWVGESRSPKGRLIGHSNVARARDGWFLRPYRPARSRAHARRIELRRILAARLLGLRIGNYQETEKDRSVHRTAAVFRVVTVMLVWLPGFLLEGLVWPERRLLPVDRRSARKVRRHV